MWNEDQASFFSLLKYEKCFYVYPTFVVFCFIIAILVAGSMVYYFGSYVSVLCSQENIIIDASRYSAQVPSSFIFFLFVHVNRYSDLQSFLRV